MINKSILLGSDYDNPKGFGTYSQDIYNQQLGIAISVGGKRGCHDHKDLNEDSIGYVVSNRFRLIVLADAYNGAYAGEEFVKEIVNTSERLINLISDNPQHSLFRKLLISTIFPISQQIYAMNENLPHSEHNRSQLSLIMVDLFEKEIYWANFGDSRIYTTWKVDDQFSIAPVDFRSLGYPMTKYEFERGFNTGVFNIEKDQAIIVCSDGFPESKSPEVQPHRLINWIEPYSTSSDAIANFMEKAFENEACDNLSVGILLL